MYKIEILYNGKKHKHKLYETEKSFERYWPDHARDCDWVNAPPGCAGDGFFKKGIVGYKDGVEIRRHGIFTP